MRLLPYGSDAVLAEVGSAADALRLHRGLPAVPGVLETVPAARTVLVVFDPAVTDPSRLAEAAQALPPADAGPAAAEEVTLGVRYDGADLDATAALLGLTTAEVVERHTAACYTVAFCGFSPGFAYLTGLDPALHAPRLESPRTSVPAGSVGVAGEFTGVYPRSSPGGWRLLGRTDAEVWDSARRPPALLRPGTAVRFVAR